MRLLQIDPYVIDTSSDKHKIIIRFRLYQSGRLLGTHLTAFPMGVAVLDVINRGDVEHTPDTIYWQHSLMDDAFTWS